MTTHRDLILRFLAAYDSGDQPLYAETFREIERSHKESGAEVRAKQVGDTRLIKLTPPGQPGRTS